MVLAKDAIQIIGDILVGQNNRGSTSCGLAYIGDDGKIKTIKRLGNTHAFRNYLKNTKPAPHIKLAIGHNRTPSVGNGGNKHNIHPFLSCDSEFALVHNGTVSSDLLRSYFIINGHNIKGFTDSEVITHLFEEILTKTNNNRKFSLNVLDKLLKSCSYSSYALLVLFKDGEVWGLRDGEPIKIVKYNNRIFIASDEDAFEQVKYLLGKTVKILEPKENKPFSIKGFRISGTFDIEQVDIKDNTPNECKDSKKCPKDYFKCKITNPNCPYNKTHNRAYGYTDDDYRGWDDFYGGYRCGRGTYTYNKEDEEKKRQLTFDTLRKTKRKGLRGKLTSMAFKITKAFMKDKNELLKKPAKGYYNATTIEDEPIPYIKKQLEERVFFSHVRINNQHPIGYRLFIFKDEKPELFLEQTLDFSDAKDIAVDFLKGKGLFADETIRIIPVYNWNEWDEFVDVQDGSILIPAKTNLNASIPIAIDNDNFDNPDEKICPHCGYIMFLATDMLWQCDSCGYTEDIKICEDCKVPMVLDKDDIWRCNRCGYGETKNGKTKWYNGNWKNSSGINQPLEGV